ncbi:MAG: tyrosine-type recombinase/integrase [Rhodoferax sp.]
MGIRLLPSGRYRLQIRRADLTVDEVHDSHKEADTALARYQGTKPARKTTGLTLDEAWALYVTSRAYMDKRPNTRISETSHVKPVLERLGARAVKSLVADDVDDFIVRQTKAGQAPNTIRLAVAALSSVLNFCRSKSMVAANICIGVKRPASPRVVKRMPQGFQGALMKALAHPNYRYRAVARLVLLVRETGARPGEWANSKWEWINFDQQKIIFQDTKYKREARTVPLNKAATALLAAQLEDLTINQFETFSASEWVFPAVGHGGDLRPLAYTGALRDMKDDEVIPKKLHAHMGRHEFISSLVESSDLDDSRIMSLVGHHSPTSMQIYTHARNIRFLPQLEALEHGRRVERTQELGKAYGLPTKVIESYLDFRRKKDAEGLLEDTGNELLYDAETLENISGMAQRLGKTESERIKKLMEIRSKVTKRT